MSKTAKQPKATLTPEKIVEAALALVKEQGFDFSMRQLADRLSVWPMATYRHFDNRDALRDAMIDKILGEALSKAVLRRLHDEQQPWEQRLMRFSLRMFDVYVKYPGSGAQIVYGTLHTPNGLRLIEEAGLFLETLGLPRARAAVIFQTYGFYVTQMASLSYARMKGESRRGDMSSRLDMITQTAPLAAEYVAMFLANEPRDRLIASVELMIQAIKHELLLVDVPPAQTNK